MTEKDLTLLEKWFSDYTSSFFSSDEEINKNLRLKIRHTHNVRANITNIANALSLTEDRVMLAEAIALFHDIGRFPQYEKYRTFEDSKSINHGILGSETLIKEKVLQELTGEEQNLIVHAVKFHNVFEIPRLADENIIFFIKLIRDADKLDILRVFIEHYESSEEQRASATAFGLPDTPEYSKEILERLYNKQKVSYSSLRTLNDFKLMNLSWTYTLHYKASYRLLLEQGYLDRIIEHLPAAEEITGVVLSLQKSLEEKLKEGKG